MTIDIEVEGEMATLKETVSRHLVSPSRASHLQWSSSFIPCIPLLGQLRKYHLPHPPVHFKLRLIHTRLSIFSCRWWPSSRRSQER